VKNLEIARAFDLIADLLELKGENPFRIRAYRRAAQATLTEMEEEKDKIPAPALG
jgi:DNA polymerase (family X)